MERLGTLWRDYVLCGETTYLVFIPGHRVDRDGLPGDLWVPQLGLVRRVESSQVGVGTHQCPVHVGGADMDLAGERTHTADCSMFNRFIHTSTYVTIFIIMLHI